IARISFGCSHGSVSRPIGSRGKRLDTARRLPQHAHSSLYSRQFAPLAGKSDGFSLIVALVMVALMAVIAVGVFTVVSLERVTATSYSNRYQADLAAQNGLQAAAKTLLATPDGTNPVTGKDTFLVVRADGPAENGST